MRRPTTLYNTILFFVGRLGAESFEREAPGARRAPPRSQNDPMRNPFINDETIDLEIIGVTIAVP